MNLYEADIKNERHLMSKCHMYFVEVGNGLFYLEKNRMGDRFSYGDTGEVARHLNGHKAVGVKFLNGDIIYNKKVPMPIRGAE